MNTVATAWTLWIITAAVAGFLLSGIIHAIAFIVRRMKTEVLLADEEGGRDYLGPLRIINGQFVHGKGDAEKRYPIKEASRRMTQRGPLYIITRQKGVNLTVPTKDDIEQSLAAGERAYFDICDPLLLAKVTKNRTVQETLEGQNPNEDWKKTAIPWIAGLAGVVVIVLGIVAGVAVGGA